MSAEFAFNAANISIFYIRKHFWAKKAVALFRCKDNIIQRRTLALYDIFRLNIKMRCLLS
jgi:hypothetical protein